MKIKRDHYLWPMEWLLKQGYEPIKYCVYCKWTWGLTGYSKKTLSELSLKPKRTTIQPPISQEQFYCPYGHGALEWFKFRSIEGL